MIECIKQALNKADIGIIILDTLQNILFWNEEMEYISNISNQDALNRRIDIICPKFSEARYQNMLENVLQTGQSRFCSCALHKAFIYPNNDTDSPEIRQNLRVDPIFLEDKTYILLQVADVTAQALDEQKQKAIIHELQKGYERIKESEEAIREKAKYDMLTGVLNRQMLENELQNALCYANSEFKKTALLFIDLDGFKSVNDQYGHTVGDVLLQQVAGRLKNNTRMEEGRAKDMIARVGGDEFLLWVHTSSKADVVEIAQRIVTAVGKPYFIDNKTIEVSVSVGIALYPDDAATLKNLIKCSDRAMYQIKRTTKNNYCFYSCS